MKTITHYFTSPNEDNECPVDRSLSRNKKQASVKVLFEKTSCSGKNKNKPIVKCSNEDEVKPTKRKRLQSRKKLKFDSAKSNSHEPCDDSDDNSTNVKQSKECIEKKMGKATKCLSGSKNITLKQQMVETITDSELNNSLEIFETNKIKKKIKTTLSDKGCKSDQNLNIKICSNDNDINKVIETKKYKQNNQLNCNKKSSNNLITISKSMKRKSINEEVSFTTKKKKSENEQINRNHSKNLNSKHKNVTENNTRDQDIYRPEICDKQNDSKIINSKTKRKSSLQTKLSEKIVEKSTSPKLPLQDMSSPIISEKQNESKSSSLKTKRKGSLQSKLPKKVVEKSILPEQPLIFKKSNNESIENNNDLKGTKNCLSDSKKNNLNNQIIEDITDSELNSSLEIFDTKKIKKKIKTSLSDKECKSDQNLDNSKVSPSDKSQGNSLFSYFNKVDKEIAMTRQQHNKIKVEALIHSPPKIEPKRSKCRNSLDKLSSISKSSGLKTKALMKASDKIDVLSSEVIKLDDCFTNSITEVSNDLSVCVNDDKITPKKKTSAIENYFKAGTMHKTPVVCKTPENNVKKISVSASKSWTMRVRLTPTSESRLVDSNTQSELVDLSIEENTFSSGHKMLDDSSDMSSYSNSQSSNEKSNEKIEKTYTTIKAEKSSTSVRMYSLFAKEEKTPKTVLDPVKLEAKVKFLGSGAPESVKRKVDYFRSESIVGNPAQFPIVTHVQQQETDNDVWNLCKPVSDLPLAPPLSQWEGVLLSSFSLTNESCILPQSMLRPPENIKAYLKELSNQEPDMAVNAVYKSLRNKKKRFGNSSEVWTEVYKPEMVSEIIGNTGNINKLKSWLQVQKNIRKREGSISSGDEFIESDSGGEEKPCMNNMAILAGPYGCGKTCAVYAIANELDCEVLEINSSCNRTGKRLLSEFSESTQSHNVDSSQSMLGIFSPSSSIKLKKKKKLRTDSIETRPTHLGKTSLLLVEDADILFPNHDEGFVSAIASLVSTSKRPVILTVNDQKCMHLTKFESVNQLQLTFNKPRSSKLALWLRIVALVEGVQLSADQSHSLVEWSNGDVRRSLLQLQLIMQSKMSQTINERSLTSLWWNWPAKYSMKFQLPTLLVNDFLKEESVEMVDKEKNKSDMKSIAKLTDSLASIDVLSPIDQKCWLNDPCPKPWQITQVDATYLSEQDVQHDFEETLNFDLFNWLVRTVILENEETLPLRYSTSSEKRWSSLLKKANNLFLPGVSLSQHCCHHAVTSDYFPALRTLGRAEQLRLATYTKRANRYFSYLKGLGIHANKSFKDLMCDCFSEDCL